MALDLVVATELPTTLALAQLDAVGAAQYSFYTNTSMADVWPEQVDALFPDALDALYLGSIGLVLEPAATAAVRAVELARARGALVMVDPNIRAALITDRAAYLARLDAVLAAADILKLSVEDLSWLAPDEPPVAAVHACGTVGQAWCCSPPAQRAPLSSRPTPPPRLSPQSQSTWSTRSGRATPSARAFWPTGSDAGGVFGPRGPETPPASGAVASPAVEAANFATAWRRSPAASRRDPTDEFGRRVPFDMVNRCPHSSTPTSSVTCLPRRRPGTSTPFAS